MESFPGIVKILLVLRIKRGAMESAPVYVVRCCVESGLGRGWVRMNWGDLRGGSCGEAGRAAEKWLLD